MSLQAGSSSVFLLLLITLQSRGVKPTSLQSAPQLPFKILAVVNLTRMMSVLYYHCFLQSYAAVEGRLIYGGERSQIKAQESGKYPGTLLPTPSTAALNQEQETKLNYFHTTREISDL